MHGLHRPHTRHHTPTLFTSLQTLLFQSCARHTLSGERPRDNTRTGHDLPSRHSSDHEPLGLDRERLFDLECVGRVGEEEIEFLEDGGEDELGFLPGEGATLEGLWSGVLE